MNCIIAINQCSPDELEMLRLTYYAAHYKDEIPFWEALIARQRSFLQSDLMEQYLITYDDLGNYNSIGYTRKLLMDTLRCAAKAMLDEVDSPYNISDDGLDYLKAATDQAAWVSETLKNDDEQSAILRVLNFTQESFDFLPGIGDDIYCFKYGYADHSSPISDLTHLNDED